MWWGRIRSRNREGRLPHHERVLAVDAQADGGAETHLYLTDYRSLYVAELAEVTDDDVRRTEGECAHMPRYYEGHAVDFWFRLFDVRRLVIDDTPAVIEELRPLRNTAYHDRPASLYRGVVDLPLVVFRDPEVSLVRRPGRAHRGSPYRRWRRTRRSWTERVSLSVVFCLTSIRAPGRSTTSLTTFVLLSIVDYPLFASSEVRPARLAGSVGRAL